MSARLIVTTLLMIAVCINGLAPAGQSDDISELKLRDWQPRSMHKTKQTTVDKPAYPAKNTNAWYHCTDVQLVQRRRVCHNLHPVRCGDTM